jgi:hypothetical protein
VCSAQQWTNPNRDRRAGVRDGKTRTKSANYVHAKDCVGNERIQSVGRTRGSVLPRCHACLLAGLISVGNMPSYRARASRIRRASSWSPARWRLTRELERGLTRPGRLSGHPLSFQTLRRQSRRPAISNGMSGRSRIYQRKVRRLMATD